jgi:UDP-glucose 4-epimerase
MTCLERSRWQCCSGIEKIVGRPVKNYKVNLCDAEDTEAIFIENPDIEGIVHFAAYKSVPESVQEPLKYYDNNINSLVNLLKCAKENKVNHFVFSSSCSVYGNADKLPVDETAPLKEAESPYARTKQMGEDICRDFARVHPAFNVTVLRYFNPVGAHSSALIGELQEKPENLVPVITQTAIGKRGDMTVFGNDYPTRDGSCVRDYIHVMDIAGAHTKALQYTMAGDNE